MKKNESINIFLSYSSKDRQDVELFRSHLMSLNDKYKLIVIYDQIDIKIGDSICKFIDDGIAKADLVLVFISPDYFASKWCQNELKTIIKKNDDGAQTFIPILLKDTHWQNTTIANYQMLPRNTKSIQSNRNRDFSFKQIVGEIDNVLHSISKEKENRRYYRFDITLNTDFDKFTEEDKHKILKAISEILKSSEADIKIVNKKRGSVRLTFEVDDLDENKIRLLKTAFNQGKLDSVNALNVELAGVGDNRDNRRPKVFIGSSSEGLEIAEAIQLNLDYNCEVTIWSQGVFGLGSGTLETLVQQINNFDFAILILTPDDMIESRGILQNSARDNVLFELGLFMGKLGRYRTFAVYDRTAEIKIPSDLAGVSIATYQPHSSGNIDAALGASCTQIKRVIKEFGIID